MKITPNTPAEKMTIGGNIYEAANAKVEYGIIKNGCCAF